MSTARFEEERARLNDLVLDKAPLSMRRFFAVDHDAYEDGALPKKTKELLGLVASLALRCDDCITYHLIEATRAGATREEIEEALTIATVVGGSITIPHLRRAHEALEEIAPPAA
ncbi:carboxymuconolactone decarboxylase family protein [Candidatus Bipolaricaulota bacterium]|nr:carboxymuconolactone decarboxylase family protein [Candidatus Bipolaricaulota bacterium]